MGDTRRAINAKVKRGSFLDRLKASVEIRHRIFVVMTGGVCLEFRSPEDDQEYDRIIEDARQWAARAAGGKMNPELAKVRPKSPMRVARAFVASKLMVAGYDGYDIEDGEVVPVGEAQPALTFAEWLDLAKTNFQQFDTILDRVDAESVRIVQTQQHEEFEREKKESTGTSGTDVS